MKKSVTYMSILIGGAFLLTSPSYASAESAYPEVQSFTMENSITDNVSACFAFDNTYGVVSDNRSELTADGFKKTNIDDQEAYCKNLGKASDLPDLYEKQFTYMGTYKLGNETKDFSIYNLPVFIGRHSIPATSSKYLKAQLQHDYEQEKISKDEYDIITFVLDTIMDDVIYQNPNEGGFMPNMNAAIVDYDKFMNLRESMGAESWEDIEFFK